MFIHNIDPVLFSLGPFHVRYYGLFWLIGFVIAYFVLIHLVKIREINMTKDDVSDFLVYVIVGIIIGARLFYVLVYNPQYYLQNPMESLAIWNGGLSFHGGFLGAIAAGLLFIKRKKLNFYDIADLTVVPLAFGLALGRIGNFLNGELVGHISNVPWCIDYSKSNFLYDSIEGCRHPSQIYASIKNFIIFGVLWSIKGKNLPKGFMFWTFVTLYSSFRLIVGFFRAPDPQLGFIFLNLTMGQLLNIIMFLVGIYFLHKVYKK
jgi:phosphatidylglycerol---prolipoprotein diacylglyceryl transferase